MASSRSSKSRSLNTDEIIEILDRLDSNNDIIMGFPDGNDLSDGDTPAHIEQDEDVDEMEENIPSNSKKHARRRWRKDYRECPISQSDRRSPLEITTLSRFLKMVDPKELMDIDRLKHDLKMLSALKEHTDSHDDSELEYFRKEMKALRKDLKIFRLDMSVPYTKCLKTRWWLSLLQLKHLPC
ncbi:unnamed protein product [Lepeophtheirus salmonis]|uniref:(salmon louse) hypothetical protein n=1 Tax=Lepeophtheirus salmonis TaxID=72036 RepID=A0A817FCS1_LEPSM|nr:unnamed protein product [Lepeophtheirus salmonis]